MRAIIAGGGTGGHLFPGIALADELQKEGAEIMFVGTERGLESKVVPKRGYQIKYIQAEGVMGRTAGGKLKAAFKLLASFLESKKLIGSLEPDIVIGTGGYVSVAPVLAARMSSIPTLIMEQNVVPGAANKMLAKLSCAVAATYPESLEHFPRAKTYLTGNPVRAEIFSASREASCALFGLEPDAFTVFVFGGSSGARSINNALINALNSLTDLKEGQRKIQFLHQSGEQGYQTVREAYRKLGFRAMVAPFIYQMPEAYAVADMVISRAGATTLAELTALGKPAILVPYPYAGEHQDPNARKLEEFGAARVIRDSELDGGLVAVEIRRLMENGAERAEMANRSRSIGKPDAAQKVADIARSLVKLSGKNIKGIKKKNVQAL
ncbi:MAG: undecaprenyldiphospho-muramoylpentapeptide beta-N-acetylglucosaminyltransferase [Nitrospiraceae bacterium]|nr:undecaprenyldiphospho-muramoylpentapeptide beta-N-acetylglucosaminyltransferase [Nitrospiraceae bacterium]